MTENRSSTPLRTRLLWLISLRVLIVTLLLGAGVLTQIRTQGSWPLDPFFSLVGLTYALTVFYLLTLGVAERRRWLVDLQFGLDTCVISALVLMTGGVASFFSSLYALPILAASAIQDRQGGILVGLLSSLLYGGLVLAQYSGTFGLMSISWMPVVGLPPLNIGLYTMGLGVFGFLGVAGLSGYLAERVRRADVSLEQASTQIAGLQAFNQHVIESLTSGLATTDRHGRILTFNPSAEAIAKRQAKDVLGRLIFDLLPFPAALAQTLRTQPGGSHMTEVSYPIPSGGLIDLEVTAAPLNTPGGQGGLLFVFDDVTDARRMERESRLQQRLAAVGEMAAGIAHEIRNPLASMSGSIQILRQDLPLSEDQRKLMDIVLRESERLNETIRAFLAYARPRRFATKQLDLGAVINDACLLLRHSAEFGAQHRLEVTTPELVEIEADENQVRQIIWNLATNALHAMPDGGSLRLSVATAPDGGGLLSVADDGVGIPESEIDGIFQPFSGSFGTGTGLGLAIVHRIVSDYGGEVRVHSQEGVGTTVEVKLPAQGKPARRPEPQVTTA